MAQEAFCEAFHVSSTPNSQIDIWDNFARDITPGGTPSPLLDWTPTEDEMMRAMTDTRLDDPSPMPVSALELTTWGSLHPRMLSPSVERDVAAFEIQEVAEALLGNNPRKSVDLQKHPHHSNSTTRQD